MLILAADTSLPLFSVALLRDESLVGAISLEGRSSRNEKLLPAVDWLLTESGIGRAELDLLAVTRGPGSFTGVRVGLATMQGLALALGRPVCAMSTHEAIAHDCAGSAGAITVIDDAGRGEFYLSRFERNAEVTAPRLVSAAERERFGADSLVVSAAGFLQQRNVAAACARRAAAIAAEGRLADYADVTPIYVRLAEAEVKLQQKKL